MRLTRSAFPYGTSSALIEKAVESFSASVTFDTQSSYATAARHYIEAENSLGKKFSIPPSESDLLFLTTYLLSKKLTVPTIRSYWAGIRFYLFSLGISTPPKIPPLAEQLLLGAYKQARDPVELASQRTRRAITVEMLKLLQHSIATENKWSDFEKNMRWAVMLNAWWGSFRIGELLPKNRHSYSPSSTLLASDVTFHEESAAFWLRSPKIEKEATGDIVEVWSIPSRKDIDPISVLRAYSERRAKSFGQSNALPLFLHEDGSIYSKLEFNNDLTMLLGKFPELETARKWPEKCFFILTAI